VRAVSAIDDALESNAAHAERFAGAALPAPPAKKLVVIACMDARIDVHEVLGLAPGDAHVLRNAGGVVTDDTIRSLAISQRALGTEEILVMHHTRCGMLGLDDNAFAQQLEDETGAAPAWGAGGFEDVDEDVRDSILRIKESPFIPDRDRVRGFVYDVDTGRLREVA
jgi:carbonic anhydrase